MFHLENSHPHLKDIFFLLSLTAGSILIHGYHPWAEDAALYLPAVAKLLDPRLFPFNSQFFASHAGLTFFPEIVAALVRISHLPLQVVLFLCHIGSIFLLLFACLKLAEKCFTHKHATYAGVALVAALLTLPVAGTALYIMDQYLNPRNVAAFAGVLVIVKLLDRKYLSAGLLLIFAAAVHPLMSIFAIFFATLLFWIEARETAGASSALETSAAVAAAILPLGLLSRPSAAYHEAAVTHSYFYLLQWHWYEWLGVIGPILILWCFSRFSRLRAMRNLELLSRSLVCYEIIFVVAALIFTTPARFESLARLQPMRSLYILYILLILFSGCLLGAFLLKGHSWRWIVLFLPLCSGMLWAQRSLFPASPHIEWPGSKSRNAWVQAFEWARSNTPSEAVFALGPDYMHAPGEDENGFRAIAQRSMLADKVTDGGAVAMFPEMAPEWLAQIEAQNGWDHFHREDFRRLKASYGVDWVVLPQSHPANLSCPYANQQVKVCQID